MKRMRKLLDHVSNVPNNRVGFYLAGKEVAILKVIGCKIPPSHLDLRRCRVGLVVVVGKHESCRNTDIYNHILKHLKTLRLDYLNVCFEGAHHFTLMRGYEHPHRIDALITSI
jgi:hypothetical protein